MLENEVRQVPKGSAKSTPHQDVARKMHAEHDARKGYAGGAESESGPRRRVIQAERRRESERRDGMSGGKGELIGRQQRHPGVSFERPWTAAAEYALAGDEQRDSRRHGGSGSGYRPQRLFTAGQQQSARDCVPEPAIAGARGPQHPCAEPARRTPGVDALHDAMIARRHEIQDGSWSLRPRLQYRGSHTPV